MGPSIFLSTLFSNTRRICTFLSVRDQASHGGHHSPASIAEVRNEWSCTFTPAVCFYGFGYQRCCLLHIRENFSTLFPDAGIAHAQCSAENDVSRQGFCRHAVALLSVYCKLREKCLSVFIIVIGFHIYIYIYIYTHTRMYPKVPGQYL